MADVYATLADGGWRNSPIAITKVVFPDGHVDTNWGKPHRVKVLSEGVTGEETSILHQNVQSGTATRSAINCPTAAKTGTTSELVDAWLDGYNSEYSTVVWMGYPNRRVSMTDVHGEPQQGGYLPADIWHAYMARGHRRPAVRGAARIQRRDRLHSPSTASTRRPGRRSRRQNEAVRSGQAAPSRSSRRAEAGAAAGAERPATPPAETAGDRKDGRRRSRNRPAAPGRAAPAPASRARRAAGALVV